MRTFFLLTNISHKGKLLFSIDHVLRMSNYRRANIAGATYFFSLVSYRRRPIFTREKIRLALRIAIEKTREKHPFTIDAWVLLPDHMHCIWTMPEGDSNFSKRWSMIKRLLTQQCGEEFSPKEVSLSRKNRNESGLWQRRFWEHQIRDELDYSRHVDYLHWNPVKHGHVERVVDWPYSSFHRFVKAGRLPEDWGGSGQAASKDNFGE